MVRRTGGELVENKFIFVCFFCLERREFVFTVLIHGYENFNLFFNCVF